MNAIELPAVSDERPITVQLTRKELGLLLQWFGVMEDACARYVLDDDRDLYKKILNAIDAASLESEPRQPAPTQKPELRVGQVWRTRGGKITNVLRVTKLSDYPFRVGCGGDTWYATRDGAYWVDGRVVPHDLIELISDVPQEGGEA